MSEPDALAPPPPPPRAPWIVRALAPRPAPSFGAKLREVVRRTAWFLVCEVVLLIALSMAGIQAGNAGADELEALMDRGAVFFLWMFAILLPVIEELLFRGLPSLFSNLILQRKAGQRWVLGFATALVFGAVHNLGSESGPDSVALGSGHFFDTSTLPITQFLFGLLLWDLVRRYGVWASITSHVVHNSVLLLPALAAREFS